MGWIGGHSDGGRKAGEEAAVWVKGNEVPDGDGVRRRCCKMARRAQVGGILQR